MIEEIKNKRMWSSPPAISPSEIHQHVEQFSLKTNWKLTEACTTTTELKKKIHYHIRWEGKKSHLARTCAPGSGLREKEITQVDTHLGE